MQIKRFFIASCTLVLLFANVNANEDPFTPYINNIPAISTIISEVDSGSGTNIITIRKLIFSSRSGMNKIYAVMAWPKQKGKYPAVLFLHGGGSHADALLAKVQEYARKGYVAMSTDLPGIGDPEKMNLSEGPWKKRMKLEITPRFDISQGLQSSTLIDGEVAAIEAFNLLRAMPYVNKNRIGISGYSWGGYSTTLLAGVLGKKVRAAYAVFGCGYYDLGSKWKDQIGKMPEKEKNEWIKYLDAGRRALGMKANYFLDAASNDTYFWPEGVMATLRAIPKKKNHSWGPNFNHKQPAYGNTMQQLFLDYHLKNKGTSFGKASITNDITASNGDKKIQIKVKMPRSIKISAVVLYYSEQGPNWQERVWKPIALESANENKYAVVIPAEIADKNVNWYVYVTDERQVAVSSYMYSTKK